jgi:prepilin peptidase CpaA
MQPGIIDHFVILIFAALLVWAAINDLRQFLIPNRISVAIVLLYPAHILAQYADGVAFGAWYWAPLVAGAVLFAGFVLFACNLVGGADAKLMAATALWAGPQLVLSFLIVMALCGGILAFAVLLWNRYFAFLAYVKPFNALFSTGNSAASEGGAKQVLPYGIAIACGGLFVAADLWIA